MPNNISIPGAVAIAILVVLVLIVIVRNVNATPSRLRMLPEYAGWRTA